MNNTSIVSIKNDTDPNNSNQYLQTDKFGIDGWVDLNKLTQRIFELNKARLDKLQAIIRCDNLPSVEGDETHWFDLFQNLIVIIIEHPPQGSKLFIYIKCGKVKDDVTDLTVTNNVQRFEICFYTNNSDNEPDSETNIAQLKRCADICIENKSSLVYHELKNAGCLFTLNLWGKLN